MTRSQDKVSAQQEERVSGFIEFVAYEKAVEKLRETEALLAVAERERDAYAELAAGLCVIQKVIDDLGPHSLVPSEELRRLRARWEKK